MKPIEAALSAIADEEGEDLEDWDVESFTHDRWKRSVEAVIRAAVRALSDEDANAFAQQIAYISEQWGGRTQAEKVRAELERQLLG